MSAENQLTPDAKGEASLTMHDVIKRTSDFFPDSRFRPKVIRETSHYTIAEINPAPYGFWPTGDGIGTKPEMAERLFTSDGNPDNFRSLAHDVLSMVKSDEDRFGRLMVGVVEIIDINSAKPEVISSMAEGVYDCAKEGRFAVLNGETAELGYRTSGYGDTHVNWNAVGISIVNPAKLILGESLKPGQPIVAFREKSIRSNGLTRARAIVEQRYLLKNTPYKTKAEYVADYMRKNGFLGGEEYVLKKLDELFGHDVLEQVLLPWHTVDPDIARLLKEPSNIYGTVMYDAQGGVDGPRRVDLVAAAHISGGGVPEKGKRMVEPYGLGLSLDHVFPDPGAVTKLMELDGLNEEKTGKALINDRSAYEQWNRGIGFLVVTADDASANELVRIANSQNIEAAIPGRVIDKPEIQIGGHVWTY